MRTQSLRCLKLLSLAVGLTLTGAASSVYASGFQLFEYSGAAVGNYNAGGAAEADDATTATTNPAGLVRLQKPTIAISAMGLWTQNDFNGTACGGLQCIPTPAHESGGGYHTIPAMQIAIPINDVLVAGLSVTSPFGLSTNYDKDSTVGYTATLTQLQTIDISPSLGVKVTDKLSVGAGLDAQKANGHFDQTVNVLPTAFPNAQAKNTVGDWAYGWNVGALYQFTQATRFGVDFHSHVVHKPSGTSSLTGGDYMPAYANVHTKVELPAYTTVSGFHQFNDQWSLMGSATYTNWKEFQSLDLSPVVQPRIVNAPPPIAIPVAGTQTQQGAVSFPQSFDSTWRVAVGTDFQVTDHWLLRVGAGHDSTPVNDTDRGVRLPDGDRYALAGGVQYKFNPAASLDAGYTHLFISDGKINQQQSINKTFGTSDNSANVAGIQLNLTMV